MLADVRQKTIQPVIGTVVTKGALVHTDEYASYARLTACELHPVSLDSHLSDRRPA